MTERSFVAVATSMKHGRVMAVRGPFASEADADEWLEGLDASQWKVMQWETHEIINGADGEQAQK